MSEIAKEDRELMEEYIRVLTNSAIDREVEHAQILAQIEALTLSHNNLAAAVVMLIERLGGAPPPPDLRQATNLM